MQAYAEFHDVLCGSFILVYDVCCDIVVRPQLHLVKISILIPAGFIHSRALAAQHQQYTLDSVYFRGLTKASRSS